VTLLRLDLPAVLVTEDGTVRVIYPRD